MNSSSTPQYLGHPRGLFLLFGTEMWERFSYYAMRALLVLYLTDQVSSHGGGLGWDTARALQLYGSFTMCVYLTPVLGGYLADRYLGQRLAVLAGCLLMACGQFMLAVPPQWFSQPDLLFYLGLTALVAGNGLFKPNISTMVGDLYHNKDPRRDSAYTIFYLGINSGMFLAGIAVGLTIEQFAYQVEGQEYRNYQAGFLLAGIGMLLAFVLHFLLAPGWLGEIGLKRNLQISTSPVLPLTAEEQNRLKSLLLLGLFTVIFWAGFEQAGGLMTIYADRFVDRELWGMELNPTYFQSLNPFFILVFAPILAGIWLKAGDRGPSAQQKFVLGLLFLSAGFVCLVLAGLQYQSVGKASLWWLVLAYLCHTLGELCISPVGLSMVSRLAPLRMASLVMGIWYLFIAMANKVAGWCGALIGTQQNSAEQMQQNAMAIFAGFAITAAVSALVLWLLSGRLLLWIQQGELNCQAKAEPGT
jgi:POT family proton-dependent oligopeptide transporter